MSSKLSLQRSVMQKGLKKAPVAPRRRDLLVGIGRYKPVKTVPPN